MGLTRLTHLNLDSAFGGASWAAGDWANKLSCLSRLRRLRCLGLGGNELPALPPAVTDLTQLETVRGGCAWCCSGTADASSAAAVAHHRRRPCRCCCWCSSCPRCCVASLQPSHRTIPTPPQLQLGMCPLGDGGLPPGPYLSRLQHLDLRCARCCTLPQASVGAGLAGGAPAAGTGHSCRRCWTSPGARSDATELRLPCFAPVTARSTCRARSS